MNETKSKLNKPLIAALLLLVVIAGALGAAEYYGKRPQGLSSKASVSPYTDVIAANNPIAYYRMDNATGATITDTVSGNNLTLTGSYTQNAPGLLHNNPENGALKFTGGNAVSTTGISAASGMTASMLVKWDEINTATIFKIGEHQIRSVPSSGELQWYYNYPPNGFNRKNAFLAPEVGRIYHLAIVTDYAAKTISIYIDGKLSSTTSVPEASIIPLSNGLIKLNPNSQEPFKGSIDEVAIFDTALSDAQIKNQFAAARGADASQTSWYAGPNATSPYARGTSEDPLPATEIGSFGLVQPGHTVLFKAGTYNLPFQNNHPSNGIGGMVTLNFSGTSNNRITVKEADGLYTAKLNGQDHRGNVFKVVGSNLDVIGFEIYKQPTHRVTDQEGSGGQPMGSNNTRMSGSGIENNGADNRFYYNYIHDIPTDPISDFERAHRSDYFGTVLNNNGWNSTDRNHGHGLYTQNRGSNGQKKIRDIIVFGEYGSTIKIAGSDDSYTENYLISGAITYNSGFGAQAGGGSQNTDDIIVDSMFTYNGGLSIAFNGAGDYFEVTNSKLFGGFGVLPMNSGKITGNTIGHVTEQSSNGNSTVRYQVYGSNFADFIVDNNTYYHAWTGRSQNMLWQRNALYNPNYNPIDDPADPTSTRMFARNFTEWKAATGWDANSTYHGGQPTSYSFAKPTETDINYRALNAVGIKQGHMVVYNWGNQPRASADLSQMGFVSGESYEVRNAANFGAGALATGTYNGTAVSLPLSQAEGLSSAAIPTGESALRFGEPSPEFVTFVVLRTSGGGGGGPAPDTTNPNVSITSPAASATVSGSATLSATATDNIGVVGVQFKVDGTNVGSEDTSSPYSISWNSASVSNGAHTITAVARDAAGNTKTSTGVSVTVSNTVADTTAPTVSIAAPLANAAVSGTAQSVIATAADNVGVVGVQFKVDGTNVGSEDTSSPYSISWNTTTVSNGTHTITAVVRDAAGNSTTSTGVSVTVTNTVVTPEDTTPPTVSVTSPSAGSGVLSGTTTLTATAADNVGVVGVTFKVDGVNIGSEDTSSPYSISWNTTTVSNGSRTITAVARDAAGNSTTSSGVTVTVLNTTATPDTTPPVRSDGSPTGQLSAGTTTVTLSLKTNETAVCKYGVSSGSVGSLITFTNTNSTNHSTPVTGLTNGKSYQYFVTCTDAANNTNPDEFSIAFSIANASSGGGGGGGGPKPPVVPPVVPPVTTVVQGDNFKCDNNPTVYYFHAGMKEAYPERSVYEVWNGTNYASIKTITKAQCDAIPYKGLTRLPQGTFVKVAQGPTVYRIEGNTARPIATLAAFNREAQGKSIVFVELAYLHTHSLGPVIQ